VNRIQTIRRVWFLYGFLLIARYGSKNLIGCGHCVGRLAKQNLLKVTLGGWWCFPWGLATPIVIVQNLVATFGRPSPERERADMAAALARANIRLADVELGVPRPPTAGAAVIEAAAV
jgi:hypothetical protein